MRLFSFNWFKSKERKEYKKLKLENLRIQNDLLLKQLYRETHGESLCKQKREEHKEVPVVAPEPVKVSRPDRPFRKLVYSGDELTVVTWEGDVVTGKVTPDIYEKIAKASNIIDVLSYIVPYVDPVKAVENHKGPSEEEIKMVEESKHILEGNPDFEFINGVIYLKGVLLPIEPVVLASFIELAEKEEAGILVDNTTEIYEALKMFWRWTALNPIESSRRDLLAFVLANDITITANGLMEMYRRVDKVGRKDKSEINFISENYLKIRKAKKATGVYDVYKNGNAYELVKVGNTVPAGAVNLGNLKELYLDLPNRQENTYTDHYTGTKSIKIGQIYSEDEDKIDLNNLDACSNGLHVGGRDFGFNGAGNTGVLVLVNPMKVRAVPVYSTQKMRVSEMFIVGLMDEGEYKSQVGVTTIVDYSQEYFNSSVEELENILKDKTYDKLSVQGHKPAIAVEAIVDIANILKNRVVTIE